MSLLSNNNYPPIRLSGASVAITGAARGIGRATAELFLARGACVAIGDRDAELAVKTAAELGARCAAFPLDVGSRESYAEFVAGAEDTFGPLDVLVNNAGILVIDNFVDTSDKAIDAQLAVNLYGPIHGIRIVLPGMISRGRGHIVNISSIGGKTPTPGGAAYAASKYGVLGLSHSIRMEVAEHGVSVSSILPGRVRTELGAGFPVPEAMSVEPEDIAKAVLDSLGHRRAETTVPRWLGPATDSSNLLPQLLVDGGRKLLRVHDLAPVANASAERAGYNARMAAQVGES